MSTVSKPQPQVKPSPRPSTTTTVVADSYYGTEPQAAPAFLFNKENYMWMLGGLAIMALGFFLMAGGKSSNPAVFDDKEVYSFTRITLAPILIVAGRCLRSRDGHALNRRRSRRPQQRRADVGPG